jgi:hypothetical protein
MPTRPRVQAPKGRHIPAQGYGDTASKKRSPAAFTLDAERNTNNVYAALCVVTLGWYIPPLWGLFPWLCEPFLSMDFREMLLHGVQPAELPSS